MQKRQTRRRCSWITTSVSSRYWRHPEIRSSRAHTRSPLGDRTDEGSLGDSQTVHRRRLKAWWGAALACDADSTPLSQPPLRPERTHARRLSSYFTGIIIIFTCSCVKGLQFLYIKAGITRFFFFNSTLYLFIWHKYT